MDDIHVSALEAELVSLRKRTKVIEDQLNEVEFGSFSQSDSGQIAMDIKPRRHAAVMALAASLVDTLGKATNYVAINITHENGPLEAIVQRVGPNFITPHQGRSLAEAEVKRLLAVCAANGINESTALFMCGGFAPEKPEAHEEHNGEGDLTPWCMMDINASPNALHCDRCGERQDLPERKTAKMIKAMVDAFSGVHADCVDVARSNALDSASNNNDDNGAQ